LSYEALLGASKDILAAFGDIGDGAEFIQLKGGFDDTGSLVVEKVLEIAAV
jgi:hypothetical protein